MAGIGPGGVVKQLEEGQASLSSGRLRSLWMVFPFPCFIVFLLKWHLKVSSTGILLNKMEIISSLMTLPNSTTPDVLFWLKQLEKPTHFQGRKQTPLLTGRSVRIPLSWCCHIMLLIQRASVIWMMRSPWFRLGQSVGGLALP